jgi:hypothetical protein
LAVRRQTFNFSDEPSMARGHVNRSGSVAAVSFLDLLTEYGSPWGQQEPRRLDRRLMAG